MTPPHPEDTPNLVFANSRGEILDYDGLELAGAAGSFLRRPEKEELIELPEGSELFVLPGRLPVGFEPGSDEPVLLAEDPYRPGESIQAVAAFMAPAHTAILTAAFTRANGKPPLLPLFAYTAVGWYRDRFWVAAFRSDPDPRQDARNFDLEKIHRRTVRRLKAHAGNRLIQHLGKCCLTYGCPAARNYFLDRWEAPLPSSPVCNASCAGCISLQPSGCCPATQDRIRFVPTPAEIAEIAVPHLQRARRPVVSFGQGCEGEPLLQGKTLVDAVREIRTRTGRGTINLNTNGSLPAVVEQMAEAGLDSIRVSLNSARPELHHRYYRPQGFDFEDVCHSMAVMKEHGRHVSLNYFILPGFTDDPGEFTAFCDLVDRNRPDLIQLRNLNMDPEYYLQVLCHEPAAPPMGMLTWLRELRRRFPWLRFGYFNPPLR